MKAWSAAGRKQPAKKKVPRGSHLAAVAGWRITVAVAARVGRALLLIVIASAAQRAVVCIARI